MFFDDAKKEAKVSKIPNDVNIKNVSEPNIDTLTYSKTVKTNNQLSTVLKAKQALEFGKYFTFVNAALKPTDVKKIKNNKFDNLLFTNRKILAVLKKIEKNMIDEQDTSIKHKSKDSKNQTATKTVIAQNAHNDPNNSGLDLDLPDFTPPKTKTQPPKTDKTKTDKTKTPPKDEGKNGKGQNDKGKNGKGQNDKGKNRKGQNDKGTSNDKGTPPDKGQNDKGKNGKGTSKGKNKQNKSNGKPYGKNLQKYKKQGKGTKVEPTKKPANEPGKDPTANKQGKNQQNVEVNKNPANKQGTNVEKTGDSSQKTSNAKQGGPTNAGKSIVRKTIGALGKGASIVGTGIVIGEGVYQYVNAECAADRQDAVASTVGALAGMYAGAQVGAAIGGAAGAGFFGIGAVPGTFVGGVVGGTIGAIACSEFGLWISDQFKTPLDLIPDKFKNRGPQVEYVYIETELIPYINELPYNSQEKYDKDFDIVEKRMIELVEEMKKTPTEEQQREWNKNKLVNDGIITDDWGLDKSIIKDWKKVENLSDSDLDILINDANLYDLDRDRAREIKFMRNAKTNTEAQTAVSAIDRVNQAIAAEKKRLEEYKNENTYDSFSGVEIYSKNYRRSLKTIEELQKVKRTMLGQAEKGDFKSIELDEKSRDVNNNVEKQFNSLTLQNTSSAEYFASRNFNSDSFKTQWATCYSSGEDISKNAIADFSSIKAADIQFNKSAHLGFISGEFESGGNPGVIAKDNIGYAYGAWQINSRVGGLRDFIKDIETDERFKHLAELKIDSPEFQDEWARVAKNYPNAFLEKQHEFIEKTKFKPVLYYARSAGLNTTNRAVQEVLWSQAVQHGFEGNKKIIDAAVKKVGKSSSADEIVRALYEARSNYVNGLSTLDDSQKANIINRYKRESAKAFGIILNKEFQNSEITKSVNSDTGSGISVIRLDEESENSENSENSKKNKNSNTVVVKQKQNEMQVKNLDEDKITINVTQQIIQKVEPKQNSSSNNKDPYSNGWQGVPFNIPSVQTA